MHAAFTTYWYGLGGVTRANMHPLQFVGLPRWYDLSEYAAYAHLDEDIESVSCTCNKVQYRKEAASSDAFLLGSIIYDSEIISHLHCYMHYFLNRKLDQKNSDSEMAI